MKKRRQKIDHVLQFQQVDNNLVWGRPLVVLLVGTGIYLTLRLGLLPDTLPSKSFPLDL